MAIPGTECSIEICIEQYCWRSCLEEGTRNKDCVLCPVGLLSPVLSPSLRGWGRARTVSSASERGLPEWERDGGVEVGFIDWVHTGVKPEVLWEVELTIHLISWWCHLGPRFYTELWFARPVFIFLTWWDPNNTKGLFSLYADAITKLMSVTGLDRYQTIDVIVVLLQSAFILSVSRLPWAKNVVYTFEWIKSICCSLSMSLSNHVTRSHFLFTFKKLSFSN